MKQATEHTETKIKIIIKRIVGALQNVSSTFEKRVLI